jgi:hypothetical protein
VYAHTLYGVFGGIVSFAMKFFIWYMLTFAEVGEVSRFDSAVVNTDSHHLLGVPLKTHTNVGSGLASDFCVHKITFLLPYGIKEN